MLVILNEQQQEALFKPNLGTGGFQSLMRDLQNNFDVTTAELKLNRELLEKILNHTAKDKSGGWQARLKIIFDL